MRWFNKYSDYLLLAALAFAAVMVMSHFLHWQSGATLAVYAGSLFAGLAFGFRLFKARLQRQRARRNSSRRNSSR
ncbi:MAG: hypothetical protein M1309_00525 [Actinobacteria bacterium]|nr:hypothetical protein [Actinomycetota bacterium]